MVDQRFCTDLHAFRACPSRLPGKRAWPVPRGRRRSNAPPLPDWRIWFFVLEACGLAVQLVNAAQARNLPGRPKTDKLDAMWLARLTEMGLLRPSFVPPAAIRDLRDYTRARARLIRERTRCFQQLEKLLEGALVKISSVASKLTTLSAQDMIKAMIAGQRDPRVLAGLARTRMKAKHDDLVQALDGMFDDHHGELARLLLDQIAFLDDRIAQLTARAAELTAAMPAAWGIDPDGTTGPGAGTGPDAPVLPAAQRLAEIPGVSQYLARAIIAEVGLDMTRFPAAAHLVSWAGLCPAARQPGPRTRAGKKGQGNAWLRASLGQAATGAARTATFLGERYHRIARRRGTAKAQVAVARSILGAGRPLARSPRCGSFSSDPQPKPDVTAFRSSGFPVTTPWMSRLAAGRGSCRGRRRRPQASCAVVSPWPAPTRAAVCPAW
jgi:transposase